MSHALTLHIGLPKTGSTFLQETAFPGLAATRFRDRPVSSVLRPSPGCREAGSLFAEAMRRQPLIWDGIGARLLAEAAGPDAANAPYPPLVSDEAIGRAASRPVVFEKHLERLRAAALDVGFAALRIVALVRRQDAWLASSYAQQSDRIPSPGQKDFEARVHYDTDPTGGLYGFGQLLMYDRIHETLSTVCEPGDLFFRLHESLEEDQEAFLAELGGFLGDRPSGSGRNRNVRRRGQAEWALRPRSGLAALLPVRAGSIRLTPAVTEAVAAAYGASNARLAARTGLDLAAHGYALERA